MSNVERPDEQRPVLIDCNEPEVPQLALDQFALSAMTYVFLYDAPLPASAEEVTCPTNPSMTFPRRFGRICRCTHRRSTWLPSIMPGRNINLAVQSSASGPLIALLGRR